MIKSTGIYLLVPPALSLLDPDVQTNVPSIIRPFEQLVVGRIPDLSVVESHLNDGKRWLKTRIS